MASGAMAPGFIRQVRYIHKRALSTVAASGRQFVAAGVKFVATPLMQ
jgi:hypothetical protein